MVSFANVYMSIAEFVGLEPSRKGTFDLHRSRIPINVFKSIVANMDVKLMEYCPPHEQMTEESTSSFLPTILNPLMAEFGSSFKNLPELSIEDRIPTKDRTEHYFEAFGSISIVFVEIKFKIGDLEDNLKAISQVIADSGACDCRNNDFNVPVFGILCDGRSFEFYKFDRSTSPPSFTRGCLPGDPPEFRRGLHLSDFTLTDPARFMSELIQICEVIFDLLMSSFVLSLTAFQQRGKKDREPRKSLAREEALTHAKDALDKLRKAKREGQLFDNANVAVKEAMKALKRSVELVTVEKTS